MRRRSRWGQPGSRFLAAHSEVRVRFQEVDALRVVWHGNYLSYCEEGRTAFGREYGFTYQAILDAGFVAPLVHFEMDYFKPARFDQVLHVETRLHLDPGAKIHFSYVLTEADPRGTEPQKIMTGRSVQVFTDIEGQLQLTQPPFYTDFLGGFAARVRTE